MFDLDCAIIPTQCPKCSFYNDVSARQVRLNDVVICRGCKGNVQLVDYMGTVSNAREALRKGLEDLAGSLSRTFTIRIGF